MIHASSPPPNTAEVTVTAPDRAAALESLLKTGLHTLAQRTTPGDPTLSARIPAHLLQVTRVLHDQPGPDGHTVRAQVALPYGLLERAALHARPDLTLRPLHVRCTDHTPGAADTPGAARQALERALTDVGFTVTPSPHPAALTLHGETWVQPHGTLHVTCVAAAQVQFRLPGQPTVSRDATGSGPTPPLAADTALTHAANLCAHPIVLTLLETP